MRTEARVSGLGGVPRRFRPEDGPAVTALLEGAKLPTAGLEQAELLVVDDPGEGVIAAVGGLEIHGEVGLVRSVVVAKSHRGRGLSRAVMEALESLARERRLQALFLLTRDAAPYFRRLGWIDIVRAGVPSSLHASAEWNTEVCPETAPVLMRYLVGRTREEMREVIRAYFDARARGPAVGEPRLPYSPSALVAVADSAVRWSLGCGTPLAFAAVQRGEVVVDLGCGAGLDAILASEKVGRDGRVLGIDLSEPMIERARGAAGSERKNLAFEVGRMEALPVADGFADLVIVNCALNFVTDKELALREIVRILRRGGRLVAADIVTDVELPLSATQDAGLVCAGLGWATLKNEAFSLIHDSGLAPLRVLRDVSYADSRGFPVRSVTVHASRP